MSPTDDLRLFAVTAPGLEPLTAQELRSLGFRGVRPERGGVELVGSRREVMRANLLSRTVSRILVRFADFHAASFSELRRRAARLAWEAWVDPERGLAFRVTSRRSRLFHTGAIEERLAHAVSDRLGRSVPVVRAAEAEEAGAQLVVVLLSRDRCGLSIDSSGALLHRRGYRLATGKAPLRETLAAAMILAVGWDVGSPLVDPFCGSGTIPIEAALLARRRAPGLSRSFAFERWPDHPAATWETLRAEARAAEAPSGPVVLASDRDAGAVEATRENAERAGVAEDVRVSRRALSALEPPPGPGCVVTNPPFGGRVSRGGDLRNLHARLGDVLRDRCPAWRIAFLTPALELQTITRLHEQRALRVTHGGRAVRLVLARA